MILDVASRNDWTIKEALQTAGYKGGKILYLAAHDHARTQMLPWVLSRAGIDVDIRIFPGRPLAALQFLLTRKREYSAIVLGFRGQMLLPWVRLIAGKRRPIVFDAFVSVYDTLCLDRRSFPLLWPFGSLLKAYDRWLCRLANAVLVDTKDYAEFFQETLGCAQVFPLYVEADPALFHPDASVVKVPKRMLWYGTCQPLQGVEKILRWAKHLEGSGWQFRLIGPVKQSHSRLLRELQLKNVELVEHVAMADLRAEIVAAELCLGGPFGDSDKAKRVIPIKTMQMLACGATVLVADTAAMRDVLS